MRTHTFTANRLDQALKRVKRELGANAVIVSSRRIDANQFEVRAIASEDATAWEPPPLQATPTRESLLSRLLARAEVSPDLAARLCAQVETQPRSLRDAQEALAAALETTVHFNVPPLDQGQMALAFVGPTGVGKTTTLAKLAARTALILRRRVGIITLDSYRIGAVAQVEQYAELIGVPCAVATDRGGFDKAMRRLADAEVIFIDTPGRAPRDKAALSEMAEILHDSAFEVEVTLCTAAATRREELEEQIERHAVLAPATLTVTKADEARRHGSIVDAQVSSGLPLAWVTHGQRVPEDIDVLSPTSLAAALCGEEVYE